MMGMGDSSGRTTHIGIESGTIGCTTTQVRRRREGAQRGTESKDRQRNLNIELERREGEREGRERERERQRRPPQFASWCHYLPFASQLVGGLGRLRAFGMGTYVCVLEQLRPGWKRKKKYG